MAAVTLLGSVTFDNTSGTKTVTATPAVGDLIVIIAANSGSTSSVTPTDDNSSGTYTTITSGFCDSSSNVVRLHIRDSLVATAASTVFTYAPGTTSGGFLAVLRVTGIPVAGAAAARQSANQSDISGGLPAPVLGVAPLTANPLIGAILDISTHVDPRAGWTEWFDDFYTSPTTVLEIMAIDSGETSSTITWGSTGGDSYGDVVVELNAGVSVSVLLTGVVSTGRVGAAIASIGTPVPVTGVQATGHVGNAVVAQAEVFPSGVCATGALGTVAVIPTHAHISVTGLYATGAVGTTVVSIPDTVVVTGLQARGHVGSVLIWEIVDTAQAPNWTRIAA